MTTTPSLTVGITCPECGDPVRVLTVGKPDARRTATMIACDSCHAEQLVTVILQQTRPPRKPRRS